jgi:hypothetical protein
MARQVNMATAPRSVRQQMATSTRQRTVTHTATPGAVGVRRMEVPTTVRNPMVQVIQAHPAMAKNPAAQVTRAKAQREAILLLRRAGEGRKRAAGHQPSAAAVAVGNPVRRVLAVQRAGAVVVAVAGAGSITRQAQATMVFTNGGSEVSHVRIWRIVCPAISEESPWWPGYYFRH